MEREHKLDRQEGVLLGVCVRLARRVDVDARLVRVNAVLLALLLAPLIVPAYGIAGLLLARRTVTC